MAGSVELSEATLSPLPAPPTSEVPPDQVTTSYSLTLSVVNETDRRIHAISELRGIRYEQGARVLSLELIDEEAGSAQIAHPPPPPSFVAVDPGAEAKIVIRLMTPIRWIEPSEGGGWRARPVRLPADVERIQCLLAYTEEAPPSFGDLTAGDRRDSHVTWTVLQTDATVVP